MKKSTIDRLLSSSDASKLVDDEIHNEVHLLIIEKINKTILKKRKYLNIENVPGYDANHASEIDNIKEEIFNYLDKDIGGIKSLLLSKGYLISDKKLITIDERQEESDGQISGGGSTRFYRYQISWFN
jgi:bifunctional ADP-heptose synthase (sugar kinase/adenylyltransferase)